MELCYVVLFSITCLLVIKHVSDRNIDIKGYYLIVLLFGIVAIFLRKHSPDIFAYEDIYKWGGDRIEPLFMLIVKFFRPLNKDVITLVIFVTVICCLIKPYLFYKMSPYPLLSILLWFANLFIMQEIIAYRAALTSACILASIYFSHVKKPYYAYASLILSFGFHYSSIIAIPFLFVSEEKTYRKAYLSVLAFAYLNYLTVKFDFFPFLNFLNHDGLKNIHEMYEENEAANPFNLVQIAHVSLNLLLWYKVDTLKNVGHSLILFLKMHTIACCMFPLFFNYVTIAIRSSDLLMISSLILYPAIMDCVKYRIIRYLPIAVACVLGYFTITSRFFY